MAKAKKEENIIVLSTKINDDIIAALRAVPAKEVDPMIKDLIDSCVKDIKDSGEDIEIFEIGPHYIVTENSLYIAVFEDQIEIYEE